MIDYNKEIAKMLGWIIIKDTLFFSWVRPDKSKTPTWKKLQFDTDWNLLMDAVKFILNLPFTEATRKFHENTLHISKEQLFKDVAEFAIKYNKK